MLDIIKVFIMGIVEGITEWLPISSTGHLILVEEFISMDFRPEFWNIFVYVIQLGAILAVVWIYFDRLNPFSSQKSAEEKKQTWETWFKVVVGCIPAGVIGLLFNDFAEEHFQNWVVVSAALIIYGIAFIVVENRNKNRPVTVHSIQDLSYKKAFQIGLFQALSVIPGTSRSGSSILGATILGTSRPTAADFSFFMSIPIMFGMTFLKLTKGFLDGFRFSTEEGFLLILGMVIAYIVSILTIRFLLRYVQKNDFKAFGWYRIALGIIVIIFFAIFQ
ncbi:undecaprenyl-diphosphate phosphatase [Aerococcus urinae]|uniref:undecaprenyl-diphosphate phosphatase n=2 Tax=Aerococcus urinae TaxID=1376 RepID=UPI00254CFE22|nr:undecaprenyl-diphosphate phosphatase [Aerococcus urinae]MDK6375921.1 undecaprenyl-diphosphate phosphatase [Aerococcus urinae]MDK8075881.1 undecaprenyl-diphosphate phosphatase [Aerococcus urinae]MDK8085249.1 undecaprenyl-diphosphate phosphatase [Aerococcus urinae]